MSYMIRQNVGLDRESHEYLDRFVEKRGLVKASLVSQLVKWWGRQDSMIQCILVGLLPEEREGQIALVTLARLMEKVGSDPATEAQLAEIRVRLEALQQAGRPGSSTGESPKTSGRARSKGVKPKALRRPEQKDT